MKDVLRRFKTKKVTAAAGQDSKKRCILGMRGEDKIIEVPTGVTIYNEKKYNIGKIMLNIMF